MPPDSATDRPSAPPPPAGVRWRDGATNAMPDPASGAGPAHTERVRVWAGTMAGHGSGRLVRAHADTSVTVEPGHLVSRLERERRERDFLTPGATLSAGAGQRAIAEEPDPERTCFERDRDRIVHSTAFRRLAGKTQVVVYPTDHQRTRLTHALEVTQVALAVARAIGLNVALTEAIALGHDCGHGPGGHASEDAFGPYVPGGYDHGPWGADVVLAGLNLCRETLDGIRNHSWSRPAPATPEGEVVSWADRVAYCAHDLEDASWTGIVSPDDLPGEVAAVCGRSRREQIHTFVAGLIDTAVATGEIGLDATLAEALAGLRAFNYERIYTRPESVAQSDAVIEVLRGLVEYYAVHPATLARDRGEPVAPDRGVAGQPTPSVMPGDEAALADPVLAAVTHVAGMTDRFAFEQAQRLLGWDVSRLPPGLGRLA